MTTRYLPIYYRNGNSFTQVAYTDNDTNTTDKLACWPVGSIYFAFNNTSPASRFGGTWTQLTGRFVRMANDTNTGGSNSHNHLQTVGSDYNEGRLYSTQGSTYTNSSAANYAHAMTYTYTEYGNPKWIRLDYTWASDNIPEFQNVYAWRRTA